jgi:hypothetical protein
VARVHRPDQGGLRPGASAGSGPWPVTRHQRLVAAQSTHDLPVLKLYVISAKKIVKAFSVRDTRNEIPGPANKAPGGDA